MGKTYKSKPHDGYYRRCRGRKNAKINNARSIPPSLWDDQDYCRLNYTPWRAVKEMYNEGWPEYEVFERISKKFNLNRKQASSITDYFYGDKSCYSRYRDKSKNITPDGFLKIWRTTRVKVNKYK